MRLCEALGCNEENPIKFRFKVLVLNSGDKVIGEFTDVDYDDNLSAKYKDWEVADRCTEFNPAMDTYVMTIRIREEAE